MLFWKETGSAVVGLDPVFFIGYRAMIPKNALAANNLTGKSSDCLAAGHLRFGRRQKGFESVENAE